MAVSPETIDKIRLSTDIVELIKEYIPAMKKSGRNWKANCPFHHEKTPSFMVNAEKGIFHCFGCHAGGDAFKFVMQIDNLTWPEALKKLAARSGITITETKEEIVRRSDKQKIYDLLELAAKFYNRCLKDPKTGSEALGYLRGRGVNDEAIERFLIGFSPRGGLISAATKKGYTPEQLAASGLVIKTERGSYFEYMSGRLVFPIFDTQGRVVAFGGRTLKDEQPKYLNTPETPVYSKSSQLYGLFQAIPSLRHTKEAIIIEGYMDVVVTHQLGVTSAVATLGTALTQQHSRLLVRYCEKVVLLFDADQAGKDAARRAIDTFLDTDISIKVANLPDNLDPDEYILKEKKENFLSFIDKKGVSAIEFMADTAIDKWGKNSPESKVKAAAEVMPSLYKVKNSILRREWIRYLAERLAVSESAIEDEWRRSQKHTKTKRGAQEQVTSVSAAKVVRSSEEVMLQIIIAHPEHCALLKEDIFIVEKHRRIFGLITKGVPLNEIVSHIGEDEISWFTELTLEDRGYLAPEQLLNDIVKSIKQHDLESQRKELEKEVALMINGKIPLDNFKIQLYNNIIKQLKGSVKYNG